MNQSLIELLRCIHKRRTYVRERYGHTAATMTTLGEGVYLFSNVIGAHEIEWIVYCGLAVIWVGHTIIVGLED